ncbi:hypothetical protein N7470_002688 [Penicillium chermesinum]|nr:hypothetical protein N7470_002688 [Penicillium chermesinum]
MADLADSWDAFNPQEYYAGLKTTSGDFKDKFQDIDDPIQFVRYMKRLGEPDTRNFVLDFGNEDAFCATNLTTNDFQSLLSKRRARCFGTRWINIWSPEEQKDTIKLITSRYGVSERLQGLMCTEPVTRKPQKAPEAKKRHSQSSQINPVLRDELEDLENATALKDLSEKTASTHDTSSSKRLTFSQVIDQIWHFSSVDYGPRYTCLGYDTLFVAEGVSPGMNENGRDLPEGTRIWTWLILCDDGTVISMQENPFPRQHELQSDQKKVVDVVRRNIRFIVSGVSKQHANTSESESLVTVRVRHFNDDPDQASIQPEDGPSLIFYYIFDDWVSSYGLIAKRQHQYGVSLERLRSNMLHRPDVDLVGELHSLGRRLAVLKRVYQSYELIMRRVLQRQRGLRDEARTNPKPLLSHMGTLSETDFDLRQGSLSNGQFGTSDKTVGVLLSSAAVARFERLVDRINLYCLSEIETCLSEKDSLTFLNFNLIALKDSQAVEKLTRITILLAKATMLFLPVSLMTAYFSTELVGVKGGYTKADYWVSFAVIFVLTILLLIIFGFASDTVEGKTIYRSLAKTFLQNSRKKITVEAGPSARSKSFVSGRSASSSEAFLR